jgi:hypothetical protein
VESTARSFSSLWDFFGSRPVLASASMNLAEVPKWVIPASSAKSKSTLPRSTNGEPS